MLNYLILTFIFVFYFVLTLSGFIPLISQLYGLMLLNFLGYLSNLDIYLLNIIHCFLFSIKGKSLYEYLTPTNLFKMYSMCKSKRPLRPTSSIIQFIITTFILYISFRALTTMIFFIVNNIIMRRNLCESIHISYRASNPITNIYIGIFIATGFSIYVSNFVGTLTPILKFISSTIDKITNWFMELSVNLIPFIGPAVKQYMDLLYYFLQLFESVSEKYADNECHPLKYNSAKEIKNKFDREFKLRISDEIAEQLFKMVTNLNLYLQKKSVPLIGTITSQILCALFKLMKFYKEYNDNIGGSDKMYNFVLRGFNSGIIALTIPFFIVILMVVFWPCNFYYGIPCPRSLR